MWIPMLKSMKVFLVWLFKHVHTFQKSEERQKLTASPYLWCVSPVRDAFQ